MSAAVVECLHAKVGSPLKIGHKLFDLSVDLSSAFSQDCPPISFFRIVLRENAWLRELRVVPGQSCRLGDVLAIFSSDELEPIDQLSQRPIRITLAGIVHHEGMWTGGVV